MYTHFWGTPAPVLIGEAMSNMQKMSTISNHAASEFANAVNQPTADMSVSLEAYRRRRRRLMRPLFSAWKIVFPTTALTGLVGAGILIYAFVQSLMQL